MQLASLSANQRKRQRYKGQSRSGTAAVLDEASPLLGFDCLDPDVEGSHAVLERRLGLSVVFFPPRFGGDPEKGEAGVVRDLAKVLLDLLQATLGLVEPR